MKCNECYNNFEQIKEFKRYRNGVEFVKSRLFKCRVCWFVYEIKYDINGVELSEK